MEIVNPSCALLSNFEVMEALRTIGDTKKKFGLRNLATISYETLRFLEECPCRIQTKANILQFMQAVKPYKLTKSECLMMVNDPPSSALHIQLQIEDSEERLTEDQVNEVIGIAQQWLVISDEE